MTAEDAERSDDLDGARAGVFHDIDVTRFDTRLGRWVPFLLAIGVGLIAGARGATTALAAGTLIGVVLVLVTILAERERWAAQDVLHWYFAARRRRWVQDTGGPAPNGGPAHAEIWLGTHRRGSVPQVYRALAATYAHDPTILAREIAAMPEATVLEQAVKEWVIAAQRWIATGIIETQRLRYLAAELPSSEARTELESWLAFAEAGRRRGAGDPRWMASLAERHPTGPRTALPPGRQIRIWVSRFAAAVVFAIAATILGRLSLEGRTSGDDPPASYAETTLATLGDVPRIDEDRVWRTLPLLERALPSADRVDPQALSGGAADALIGGGLPALIWTVGPINIRGPDDAPDPSVWEIEVLLDGIGESRDVAIVQFRDAHGPRYEYRIDAAVVSALGEAAGIWAASPSP